MLNVMVLTGEAFGSYLSHKLSHLTQIKYEFKSYLNHNFPGRINILMKETTQELLSSLPSHESIGKDGNLESQIPLQAF